MRSLRFPTHVSTEVRSEPQARREGKRPRLIASQSNSSYRYSSAWNRKLPARRVVRLHNNKHAFSRPNSLSRPATLSPSNAAALAAARDGARPTKSERPQSASMKGDITWSNVDVGRHNHAPSQFACHHSAHEAVDERMMRGVTFHEL